MNAVLAPLLSLTLIFLGSFPAAAEDKTRTTEAIRAAESFLLLLDTGQYGQSWDSAADLFKKQVPKETWIRQLSGLLPPVGVIKNRTITSAEYRTELAGAPDGQYVVIRYRSSFTNKESAVETVTPMLDADGHWRVSGYFLQ
ncbi:MAG: DUF4019 domain-containing protein [Desulfobulbus sp.]|nr:MAG: DUF4019 domain-containing protein [Desulfobulbus sp.]